jgi:integrase
VLDPIWHEKPETASRVRGRVERVLDWSKVRGYRTGENPARWRGHLDKVYPAAGKVRAVQHHAAVEVDALPGLYGRLQQSGGMAARALRFLILTAARASEVTGAQWSEIDMDAATWTVPASRMKAKREHRVPLSPAALLVVKELAKARTNGFVFPGWRKDSQLSLTSLTKALVAAGGASLTVHGFRSTFRDWAAERTSFPRDVAEMALAHTISDKVEAAYRRGDLMKKRAAMMQAWAAFATAPRKAEADNVVPMARERAA